MKKNFLGFETTAHDKILLNAFLSYIAGMSMTGFMPDERMWSLVFYGIGTFAAGYYALSKSSLDMLFKNLKLGCGNSYPILNSKEKTEYSTIYKYTVPAGLSSEDFEKHKLAIEQYLGKEVEIKYTYKELWIEAFNKNNKHHYDYEITECKGNVCFPVGYNQKGKLIKCDLASGEPHLLIAGETGSGKSTTLRTIITNLILTKDIKLHLIDLKRGAEFSIFQKCGCVKSFAKTPAEAEKLLNKISNEIDRRYDLFYDKDVIDIKEYNRVFKNIKMQYEVVIVDEFADLQDKKNCIKTLEEIAAKARACGIHLIISTQRPDAKILNGRIKANVTTVIGLKTLNDINSKIIIGDKGLETLRGNGDGIFKQGNNYIRLQCPYLSTERARELLRPSYTLKKLHKESAKKELVNFDFLDAV